MIDVKYKKPAPEQGNKYKLDIPLLTLIANESTDGSRKLLKRKGKQDAINHVDLENKLADYYQNTEDKKDAEREIALIHPHKDFIINALDLVPKKDIQVIETVTKAQEVVVEPHKSDLTVKYASAEGENVPKVQSPIQAPTQFTQQPIHAEKDHTVLVLGTVVILALSALTMIHLNKKS